MLKLCHLLHAEGHWQDWEGLDLANLVSSCEVESGVRDSPRGSVKVTSLSPGIAVVVSVRLGNPHNLSKPYFPSYGIEGDDDSTSLRK